MSGYSIANASSGIKKKVAHFLQRNSMARVLLSASAKRPWSSGRPLEVAVRDLGHDVRLFDFRSAPQPNAALITLAESFRPDIHVMRKGDTLNPKTLRALSARGIYNVFWHSDADFPSWLPPLASACDLCCVQSRGMFDEFRRIGIDDPHWLMEGVTPSCFEYDEITPAERRRYQCDVGLIGTVSHRPGYTQRLDALNRLAREGLKVRWWGRRLPLRLSALRQWLSPAGRAWGGRVWGPTFAKACHCSSILLTLPRAPLVAGGLSNRAFMATAQGVFYLSLYRQGIEEFFELDREIVVFHDEDEMVEKVRYYLTHEAERKTIAEAGRRRTLAHYTNQHTFRRLFRLVAEHGGPKI